jgi:hypothetical protein
MAIYELTLDEGTVRGQVTGVYYDYAETDTVDAPEGEFGHTPNVIPTAAEEETPTLDTESDDEDPNDE